MSFKLKICYFDEYSNNQHMMCSHNELKYLLKFGSHFDKWKTNNIYLEILENHTVKLQTPIEWLSLQLLWYLDELPSAPM